MAKGTVAAPATKAKIVEPKRFEKTKKVAGGKAKKEIKPTFHQEKAHLFQPENKRVTKSKDLTRLVRWPFYVRLQRQRAILLRRLKVPPVLNQFTKTLDANPAKNLFTLLAKYRPETKKEKKDRLLKAAAAEVQAKERDASSKPKVLKFGVNHVTALIEAKKAKLIIIAHDVNPIELVIHLPALCRKMDIPYCIVKGKARLGNLVHQKTATCIAVTEVKSQDAKALEDVIRVVRPMFNENVALLKKWGGGILGAKNIAHVAKLKKSAAGGKTSAPVVQ